MLQIKDSLKEFELKLRRPKNQWSYWVNECAILTGKPFRQMAGLLRGWPTEFIKDLYQESKLWTKNPPALFWKLYKQNPSGVVDKNL